MPSSRGLPFKVETFGALDIPGDIEGGVAEGNGRRRCLRSFTDSWAI